MRIKMITGCVTALMIFLNFNAVQFSSAEEIELPFVPIEAVEEYEEETENTEYVSYESDNSEKSENGEMEIEFPVVNEENEEVAIDSDEAVSETEKAFEKADEEENTKGNKETEAVSEHKTELSETSATTSSEKSEDEKIESESKNIGSYIRRAVLFAAVVGIAVFIALRKKSGK